MLDDQEGDHATPHATRPNDADRVIPDRPTGLPEATRPQVLELAPGDTLELRVGPVAKRLGDTTVRMLGYNGSIPGPTLKVQQGSERHCCIPGDESKQRDCRYETPPPSPSSSSASCLRRLPLPV